MLNNTMTYISMYVVLQSDTFVVIVKVYWSIKRVYDFDKFNQFDTKTWSNQFGEKNSRKHLKMH